MITITVWLNSALVMGSTYDDAATRAAAIRHRTRAEYPSHIKGPYQPFGFAKHQHTKSEPQKLLSSEIF